MWHCSLVNTCLPFLSIPDFRIVPLPEHCQQLYWPLPRQVPHCLSPSRCQALSVLVEWRLVRLEEDLLLDGEVLLEVDVLLLLPEDVEAVDERLIVVRWRGFWKRWRELASCEAELANCCHCILLIWRCISSCANCCSTWLRAFFMSLRRLLLRSKAVEQPFGSRS